MTSGIKLELSSALALLLSALVPSSSAWYVASKSFTWFVGTTITTVFKKLVSWKWRGVSSSFVASMINGLIGVPSWLTPFVRNTMFRSAAIKFTGVVVCAR